MKAGDEMRQQEEKFIFDLLLQAIKKYKSLTGVVIESTNDEEVQNKLRYIKKDMEQLIIATEAEVNNAKKR